jgi:hypothetical protein
MNTRTLSKRATSVIEQYQNFRMGQAVCSVPYYNNKVNRARMALRPYIGKGSPKEIFDEIEGMLVKNKIDPNTLDSENLKKLLRESGIGIDCSGFAYYVLNAESEETGHGSISRRLHFIKCHGLVGKIRCKFRPIENCDVATLADDKNSTAIPVTQIQPGDFITMLGSADSSALDISERDHVAVIYQIDYQNMIPARLHYSHAISYPEDGLYGSGIKQGMIDILYPDKSIIDQVWREGEQTGVTNHLFAKAQKSKTDVRRLK